MQSQDFMPVFEAVRNSATPPDIRHGHTRHRVFNRGVHWGVHGPGHPTATDQTRTSDVPCGQRHCPQCAREARAANHRREGQRRRGEGKPAAHADFHRSSATQKPRAVRRHESLLRARLARSDQARSAVHVGYRAQGYEVHRRHLQQRSGKPDLQAIHPKPLSGTTASPGCHASRLHPVAGGFRRRHQDELHRRGTDLPRGLSGARQQREPVEMLELVP